MVFFLSIIQILCSAQKVAYDIIKSVSRCFVTYYSEMDRHRFFERFYVVIRPPCPGEGVDGRGKGGAGVYQGYPTFTWDMQIKSNLGSAG